MHDNSTGGSTAITAKPMGPFTHRNEMHYCYYDEQVSVV